MRSHRYVSRYGRLRIEVIDTTLDVKSLDGVGIIGRPYLRRVAKHTQIKAVSTRRAALKEDVRMPLVEYLVEDLIKTEDISMEELTLLSEARGIHIADMPVIVPLDVLDIGTAKDLINAFDNIFPDLGSSHVQHHLISTERPISAGNADSPIGMGTVKVTVGIDALGLKPETEFHSHFIDLISNISDAARELFAVFDPVAESGKVVVTLTKPAVVKDEHLDS
jgi:hypothetical protein